MTEDCSSPVRWRGAGTARRYQHQCLRYQHIGRVITGPGSGPLSQRAGLRAAITALCGPLGERALPSASASA